MLLLLLLLLIICCTATTVHLVRNATYNFNLLYNKSTSNQATIFSTTIIQCTCEYTIPVPKPLGPL